MNRFTNYLESQKLAKHFLMLADDEAKNGETAKAARHLVLAVKNQMTACNNIASLYFERRKTR